MSHVSPLFAALSDPCRLEVIEALMRDGEKSAGDICQMFDISGPAVSRHLSVLHRNGLVDRRVSGKHRLYTARPEAMQRLADWTLNHRHFWEASMDRIEAALREERQ